MLLKEFLKAVFEKKVTIYQERDADYIDYMDLYFGAPNNVPNELMNKTVRIVWAKGKSHLSVEVEPE